MEEFNKNIFLKGECITLRPLTDEDVNGNYSRWLNDPEITQYNSHGRFPVSKDDLLNFIKAAHVSRTSLVFAIEDTATGVHIGNISLQGISWVDRSAEIAFLLGEKSYWGKGIMKEAGALVIRHAFMQLNLHRIHCGTSSENKGMQKLAENLGMKQEGLRREAIFKNGIFLDVIEFGILASEYTALKKTGQ
jgi:[ribosomal protein S5]-alanine N-acetyltransferase